MQQTQRVQPRIQKNPTPKKQSNSMLPAFIAVTLIIIVFGGFYLKRLNKEKVALEEKLAKTEKIKDEETLEVPTISPKETSRAIRDEKFQFVDIREKDEFVLKHIEGSVNIPLSELEKKINLLSKTKTVVIIDRKASINGKILTEHLDSEGLTVKYLEGGIVNFAHNGYNLVTIGNPLIQSDKLKVTSYSAKEIVDQLLDGSRMLIVDTRSEVEFAMDSIRDSINIPLEDIERKKDKLPVRSFVLLDKDPIRSFQAAVRVHDMDILGAYNCQDTFETFKKVIMDLDSGEEAKKEKSTE